MKNKNQLNYLLDAGMAVGLVLAFITHDTDLHPAIGIALAAGVVVHHALHWKWIVAMCKSVSRKLPPRVRLNLVLNAVSLLAFSLTVVSGLMLAQFSNTTAASVESAFERGGLRAAFDVRGLGTDAGESARLAGPRGRLNRGAGFGDGVRMGLGDGAHAWFMIHVLGAFLTLFTILVHLALHSKMIVRGRGQIPVQPVPSKGVNQA